MERLTSIQDHSRQEPKYELVWRWEFLQFKKQQRIKIMEDIKELRMAMFQWDELRQMDLFWELFDLREELKTLRYD